MLGEINLHRPPIPAELKRKVLVEAGFKCAIARCDEKEIDVHHIIPWEQCKKHEFDNLIALCPNCHRRVHRGQIDRKALRIYKSKLVFTFPDETIDGEILSFFEHMPTRITATTADNFLATKVFPYEEGNAIHLADNVSSVTDLLSENIRSATEFLKKSRQWLLSSKVHWGRQYSAHQRKVANTVEGILAILATTQELTAVELAVLQDATTYLLENIRDHGLQSLSLRRSSVHCTALGLLALYEIEKSGVIRFQESDKQKITWLQEILALTATEFGWGFATDSTPADDEIRVAFTLVALRALNTGSTTSTFCHLALRILPKLLLRTRHGDVGFNIYDSPRITSMSLLLILIHEVKDKTLLTALAPFIDTEMILSNIASRLHQGTYSEIEEYGIQSLDHNGVEKLSWNHVALGYGVEALCLYANELAAQTALELHRCVHQVLSRHVQPEGYFTITGHKEANPDIFPTAYLIKAIHQYLLIFKQEVL